MKNARGLTLIELMVTLAVFAIITTLAFPGFQLYQQNSARVSDINDFVSALTLARGEAIKRGVPTIICASTDQATCSGVNNWATGWISFIDDNNNGAIDATDDNGALDAGEPVILIHAALSGANVVFADINTGLERVIYKSTGITNPAITATFRRYDNRCNTLPDANNDKHIRAVIVMSSGQIRLSRDADNNGIQEGLDGADLLCP
ncbi:MAG TPA: prepilin-type N-terminal cleavage/methylation domain-containing protein [Gammaproteobacteria bacterium]|nr:prepilin-type N-terminal cleavage/methylation domain-containing protein [Gammaproteobacteria bacterium]